MTRPSYATRLGMTAQKLGSGRVDASRSCAAPRSSEGHLTAQVVDFMRRIETAKVTLRFARDYVRKGRADDAIAYITRALAELDGSSR